MRSRFAGWIPLEGVVAALEEMGYETLDCEPGRWAVFRSQSPEVQAFVVHTQLLGAWPDRTRHLLAGEPPDVVDAVIARALEIIPNIAEVMEIMDKNGDYPTGITVAELDRIDAHMPKPKPTPEQIKRAEDRMRLTDELLAKIEAMPHDSDGPTDASENLDDYIYTCDPIEDEWTDELLAKIDKESSETADEDRVNVSGNIKEYLYGGP